MTEPVRFPTTADPLGEALHFLRMSGTFYCRCEFSAPWGLELPAFETSLMFHVVTSGTCWLEVDGAEPVSLRPGDLALVPHGEGHRLAWVPGAPAEPLFDLYRELLSDRYEVLRHGPDGEVTTTVLCGLVRFDHPAARHLIDVLPRLIRVEATASPQVEWILSTIQLIAAEATTLRPGGEAVITRLADVLVIQAIRAWIEGDPAAHIGWLGALRDRQVGRALTLIHRDPARAWTVAELAAAAIRHPLADADRPGPAAGGRRHTRRAGRAARLRVGSGLQPRLQAPRRHVARCRPPHRRRHERPASHRRP